MSQRSMPRALFALILAVGVPVVLGAPTGASAAVPTEAANYADAAAYAAAAGRPVEWVSQRTETAQQFVNPGGSISLRQFDVPVRVKKGSTWQEVDPSLMRLNDGSLTPWATVTPMTMSGGGTANPLLTIKDSSSSMALTWPGNLPVPSISYDTATYAEVYPGVDLIVRAEPTGYSQVLKVKTAAAAQNSALDRITFGLTLTNLRLQGDGTGAFKAVDPNGKPVFSSDGSSMWDSPGPDQVNAPGAGNVPAGDLPPHRSAAVGVQLTETSLTVVPDRAMLNAADTVFPSTSTRR
jgi:hypothetical protein